MEKEVRLMRSIPLLLAAASLVAVGATAQTLSVEDAVRVALSSNPEVMAASARADAAAAQAEQAGGHQWPRLSLMEMFTYTDSPADVFALQLNQRRFDFGDFAMSDPNNPDYFENWLTRFEIEVPVYTGAELGTSIDQAELAADAGDLDLEHARERVAYEAVSAWVDLASAREQVDVLGTARRTTDRHLELARQYAQQGMIVHAEVLRAEVYLAEVEELLVRAETGASLAEAALNFRLGTDQSIPRELAPMQPPPPAPGGLDDWIRAALDNRSDLAAARRRLEAGQLEERKAKSGLRPEVGVLGRYDLYDDTIFGSNGHNGTVMAFAKFSLSLGGSETARVEAARLEATAFAHDLTRFEDGVRLEVRQAWQDLATSNARLATAEHSVAAARESLRITETRFREGLDRMLDLLDAETALREAQMRETVARYDVARQTYRLRYVTGRPVIDTVEELQ
jgi:outer membrane protein TolC